MEHRHIVSSALLLVALVPQNGCEWPFVRKDILVGERPYAFVVGDFNGDRRPDLAVSTWEGLAVLLNEGEGNFGRPVLNRKVPDPVVVGDFDGDGRDDVAAGDRVFRSRGEGTFFAVQPIEGFALAAGDLNQDKKCDLLLGGPEGVRAWLGKGDGTFQPVVTVTEDPVRQAVVADFNGDNRNDLALLPTSTPLDPVQVLLGLGDGTFGPEIPTKIDALALVKADFNGDGLPDLATWGCAICADGSTGIALGTGNGSFRSLVPYPSWEEGTRPLAAADFTGDGTEDVVVARSDTNSISIYEGHGDGTLDFWSTHAVGWKPRVAAAVDLDGDGRRDIVTANFGASSLSVLLNRDQDDALYLERAVSAANGTAIVAPESLATLYAFTPATTSTSASPPWPTSLGGISLEVIDATGATHFAPLLFVSPEQINFQVPADAALGEATLFVDGDSIGVMQIDAVAPALFMVCPGSETPAATGVLVAPEGTQDPVDVFSCLETTCQAEPIPLSNAGDRSIYLSLFGTGFRHATPDNVTCSIYDVRLPVLYAGPQGTPGLDQINVRLLPETLLQTEDGYLGPGPVTLTMRINGVFANSTVIDLR